MVLCVRTFSYFDLINSCENASVNHSAMETCVSHRGYRIPRDPCVGQAERPGSHNGYPPTVPVPVLYIPVPIYMCVRANKGGMGGRAGLGHKQQHGRSRPLVAHATTILRDTRSVDHCTYIVPIYNHANCFCWGSILRDKSKIAVGLQPRCLSLSNEATTRLQADCERICSN